jgi:formylglycine-generating enzyme required for sulfatase activity
MDNSSNSISGSYSLNGSTVTFTPTDNLTHFRDYSVSLTIGIKDSAGNALSSVKSWSFSTLSNVVVISADSFGMVLLSGGQFEMGADNESQSDGTGNSRELPVHTVTLTGPFYVSDHEVTAAEYKACVDAGSCSYTGSTTNSKRTYDVSGEENFPINYVSWNDAANYTSWLTSNRSGTYRLCTEAEWEYAARAGSTTKWSCGNDNDSCLINYAWYDSNSRTGPKAVKTKLANSWGLYDFHGNIWELTSDYYGGSYYSEISGGATNPSGPATGGSRSTRGGGYSSETTSLRSSNRYYKGQTSQSSTLGFRVCATP